MNINFTDLDLQVLTNFSNINGNIVFKKGNIQWTIKDSPTSIIARYELENNSQIPEEFYIYDLSEFLSFLDLFDNPTIKLLKDENKIIVSDDKKTSEYYCADPKVCIVFRKDVILKDTFIEFELNKKQIKSINESSKKLNLPHIVFENKNGKVICLTTDKKNKSSNNVSFEIEKNTNQNFSCTMKVEHINKILISNYRVRISSQKIAEFVCKEIPLTYKIALEPDSEFNSDKELK